MEIRFSVVKKGEKTPSAVPFGHPREEFYHARVSLDGTPELVLKLLEVATQYAEADAEKDLVVV